MEKLPNPTSLAIVHQDSKASYYKAYKSDNDSSLAAGIMSFGPGLIASGSLLISLGFPAFGAMSLSILISVLSFVGSYKLSEAIRKRINSKRLKNPKAEYLYNLVCAIDDYNHKTIEFNRHSLGELNPEKESERQKAHKRLLEIRSELQARILQIEQSSAEIRFKMSQIESIEKRLAFLKEAETRFMLSGKNRGLLPSGEYFKEALKELDEEFPNE